MEKKKITTPRKPARNLSVRKLTKKELSDIAAAQRPVTPGCCTQGCCE